VSARAKAVADEVARRRAAKRAELEVGLLSQREEFCTCVHLGCVAGALLCFTDVSTRHCARTCAFLPQ